jgi:ribosomal protein S18 acetylase RimI-like enzyme
LKRGYREIELAVPVEDAWLAIVDGGRREWYYRLTPEGNFAEGAHIRWIDIHGTLAEESDVLELTPPTHLALRTRFVFAPNFAAEEAHRADWDVVPRDSGCRVRASWQAGDLIAGMLDAEADGWLRGLQLAVDPSARAELARLDSIGKVEVRDVTPDRVRDYQAFFDRDAFRDFPTWQSCYCMETHRNQGDEEWAARTAQDNRRDMSEMLTAGKVTALLAYADGKPVGWCNYGETTHLSGVMHRYGLEPPDHQGVGSIACFVIASQYRGHGIASRLLEAAVDRLRAKGLRAVEAYPGREVGDSAQSNYRGPLDMYLRAGFQPHRETERYVVVRKTL